MSRLMEFYHCGDQEILTIRQQLADVRINSTK